MASSAQYRIELVSAESDSGESAVFRGPSSLAGKTRRQKYYRPRQRSPDVCRGRKRLGVSIGIFFASLVFLWIFILSMMTAELFKRTLDLQRMTMRISVQTELIPEEMHSYQSMSKYMQRNQTQINAQLMAVSWRINNVSSELSKVEKSVRGIEEKFKSIPDFVNVPSQVVALSSSVAGLGSEVEDMKTSLSRFRDEEDTRHQSLESLKANIKILTNDVILLNQTFSALHAPPSSNNSINVNFSSIYHKVLEGIDPKFSELNESLSRRLRYALEDQEKDHKMLIDLQESLVNVSSQIMSLSQNIDEGRTSFNNLELKILEIREQLRAKIEQKVSTEIMTSTSATGYSEMASSHGSIADVKLLNATISPNLTRGSTHDFTTTSGLPEGSSTTFTPKSPGGNT